MGNIESILTRLAHAAALGGAIATSLLVDPPAKVTSWVGAAWPARAVVAAGALLLYEFGASVVVRGVLLGQHVAKFSWIGFEWAGAQERERLILRRLRTLSSRVESGARLIEDTTDEIGLLEKRVAALEEGGESG